MSKNCNGGTKHNRKVSKKDVEVFKKLVPSNKNFPLENSFKGFEKTPVVSVPRIDISKYLKTYETLKQSPDLSRHKKLALSCFVKVKSQDLEKLKANFKKRISSASSSDSDEDFDINMASKCNICEKLYSSEKKLLKHQTKKHMIVYEKKPQKRVSFSDHVIVHELREYHKCRKCTKIFENYRFLRTHMKLHHKKRKCYICNYCNRSFVDRMFFKVHIKQHCDVCGELFLNRVNYLTHRRNVCRIFKLHKCKTCYLSFFKFLDLKDHSYDHGDAFLICDICKDQFTTKCGLAHHISFLHSNQRPVCLYGMRNLGSERLYLCNFCEETSVDRTLIEIHVQSLPDLSNRAMTGYKDYYFCDQCFLKFDTEGDMLQHKWTHFLKTSDNSQTRIKAPSRNFKIKKSTNKESLPNSWKPVVMLEKLNNVPQEGVTSKDLKGHINGVIKNSDKTLSKYQEKVNEKCNYTNQIENQTTDCELCKEVSVPSLVKNHKCATEVVQNKCDPIINNGLDDFEIAENDDFLNTVDFDIPTPIVDVSTGYGQDSFGNVSDTQLDEYVSLSLSYKMCKEVPIEF